MSHNTVIVGAGPSGIAAAAELARYKIPSIVLEESPYIGGVVYRGSWRKTLDMPHLDERLKESIAQLKKDYNDALPFIDLRTQSCVLGPLEGQNLLIKHKGKLTSLSYQQVILATGCQERSIPFPGWQIPGVMMLGGIQLQLKGGVVRPGKNVMIVGTGPLLVLVACQLHKAGCKVSDIYEAASFRSIAKETLALLHRPQQVLDGLSMVWYLKQNNIVLHYGWGIVKAEGHDQLESVTVAPYDAHWNPDLSRSKTVLVDTLGVGYGFVSRSQLAQMMNVDMKYDHMCGVIPVVDEWQRSSVGDIYCVGDSVKLAGADAAMIEGKIAAKAIAVQLEKVEPAATLKELGPLRSTLSRYYRFRHGFDHAGHRQPGLLSLAHDDTIICRCEQVTKQAIDEAIEQGCRDMVTLKMRTRITMGDCQGKTCSHYCYDRLTQAGYGDEKGMVRPRFPLDPVPFSAMEDNA